MALNDPQIQEALIELFELIGESFLPSELENIPAMPDAEYYFHTQKGDADGKRISIEKARGFGGNYNPATNSPTLSNSTGVEGTYYIVTTDGSRDFGNGSVSMSANDVLKFEGGKWFVPYAVSDIVSVTQDIQIGDIGSTTIHEAFNGFVDQNPTTVIPTSTGFTRIKATQDGVSREWLFVGSSGVYDETNTADGSDFIAKVSQQDLYSKSEIDALLNGLRWKDPVDVATTENITLSGEQTIDGETTDGSRVLVKNQTDATENGIYISGSGSWTRATDADEDSEFPGLAVSVLNGTAAPTGNLGAKFTCNNSEVTIGTTEINFVKFSDIIDHNSATGLQGGSSGEYYHLTSNQLALLLSVEMGATNDAGAIQDIQGDIVNHESRITDLEENGGGSTQVTAPTVNSFIQGYVSGLRYKPRVNYTFPEEGIFDVNADLTADPADANDDRTDILVATNTGTLYIKKGTPGEGAPPIDPETELDVFSIKISAGATEPEGVTQNYIYAENAGPPNEWSAQSNDPSTVVDSENTPIDGTYSIEGSDANNGNNVVFTPESNIAQEDFPDEIPYTIQNKASETGQTHTWWVRGVKSNGFTTLVELPNPEDYGYDPNSTDAQEIILPFEMPPNVVEVIYIAFTVAQDGFGFFLDEIKYTGGVESGTSEDFADKRLSNIVSDLSEAEKTTIKDKLGVSEGDGSSIPASKTGTNIVFTEDALYNEKTYLNTGDLVLDLTGAVKGVVAIIYCDRYIPEITGEDYLITGSLSTTKLNELWFFWNGTSIELSVVNKTYLPYPVNATATSASNEVTIKDYSVFNGDSYEILFSTTNDFSTANPVPNYNGTDLNYTHTGLTDGTVYYYWIRAFGKGYLPSDYKELSITATSASFNTTGLTAFFKDDETTGTVSNDAHGNNDGALNNITLGATGKIGTAISLNGTTSFVDHSALNNAFSGAWTVACWVKTTQSSVYRLWQNRGAGAISTKRGFQLSPGFNNSYENTFIDVETGVSGYENNMVWDDVPYNQADGEWHLIGLSFNPTEGRGRLVIDGVIYEKVNASYVGESLVSTDNVIFGKNNNDSQYLNGLADERFVFEKELTQAEWDEMYNEGEGVTI